MDAQLIVAFVREFGNIALTEQSAEAMAGQMREWKALLDAERRRLSFEKVPAGLRPPARDR